MRKKYIKRLSVVVSSIMSVILLSSSVMPIYAKEYYSHCDVVEDEKTYIIEAKDRISYCQMKDKLGITEHEEYLEENQILTVDLTEDEAEKLQENIKVVSLEEEAIVVGSGEKKSDKKKKTSKKKRKIMQKNEQSEEWNLKMIQADELEYVSEENDETRIKIALLDSGVDETEEINVVKRRDFITPDVALNPVYEDLSGHGTGIAGIIASTGENTGVKGINPDVEIYSARILDAENQAPLSRVLQGIYWAIEEDVDIISMSFGMQKDSPALEEAVKAASEAGILLIASAGNTGADAESTVEYPAAYPEVMAVGAVDKNAERTDSSAVGDELEIMAPGEQICSTGAFGGVSVHSGTSLAVPHVVGVASVLWQKDRTCSSEFIRELLKIAANELGDSFLYGEGLLDMEYALSIYDTFKSEYDKVENFNDESEEDLIEKIEENDTEIEKFPEVNYVEGSWKWEDHIETAERPDYCETLTDARIKLIKIGALLPDILLPYNGGNGYPGFHSMDSTNYIAYYYLVGNIARTFYNKGNIVGTKKMEGELIDSVRNAKLFVDSSITNDNWANKERSGLKSINWDAIKNTKAKQANNAFYINSLTISDSKTLTCMDKSYIIAGMAVHLATDVFSHRASRWNGSEYVAMNHTKDPNDPLSCDNKGYISGRFKAAKVVAERIIKRLCRDKAAPSLNEFAIGYSSKSYIGNKFRIRAMKSNAVKVVGKNNATWTTQMEDFAWISKLN